MDNIMLKQIKKGEIYGIVPARAGSKGIKDKNIRSIQGYPMIAFAIAAGKLCPYVSRVIVTTDSERYAQIAKYYGGDVPFLRPGELARDDSADFEFMEHAIAWLSENEGSLPEYFMHIRPTTPLRECGIVSGAVHRILSDDTASSLRSSHLSHHTPYKWFGIKEDGYYKTLLGAETLDEANNPRQSFEPVYIPDGYVDILKTAYIIKNNLLHGDRCISYVVSDSVDVDMQYDLERINYFLEKNNFAIYEYLKKNYKPLEEVGL